ncbi:MAG: selenocysteine-specific translation elongation factor [Pirellulaceae bacterium]|nr:MAG: selenocysteine-specific translation elongation factor [Pirellulaceae bacterium]
MAIDLILGTAGHIDHGKTSLIKALTGVDTDRLPEEKRRGITIDLGFACLELGPYRLGIVDVPGHERFVRNMLAGATGMDLALLVVAADDSVKPQTLEHLEILRLLDLPAGVVALTKCDLVEAEWLEAVAEEIREVTRGTCLEQAPIVPTSVVTGQGLDELRQRLQQAAATAAERRAQQLHVPFRMAIDRVFSVAGHGTVVTGSVSAGRVSVGDELLIEPGSIKVRVRGLQNHDRPVAEVHRGQRAAINLTGVHHEQIRRGHELAAPGHLEPARCLTVRITLSRSAPRPLKNRSRVRLHMGTAELLVHVRLLGCELLAPGEHAWAQLVLPQPAVAVWRQPFIIRSESPVLTIGGGVVIDPHAERLRKFSDRDRDRLQLWYTGDPEQRADAALFYRGWRPWQPPDLARMAGVTDPQAVLKSLLENARLLEIPLSAQRRVLVHRELFDQAAQQLAGLLERLHREQPLRMAFDPHEVASRIRWLPSPAYVEPLMRYAAGTGLLEQYAGGVRLPGHGPALSHAESQLLEQIVQQLLQAGIEVPSVAQLQASAGRLAASVPALLGLAVSRGELVQISDEFYLHAEVDRQCRTIVHRHLEKTGPATLSQIREWLGTSRKYAVPYCEYLDRVGMTVREGDKRRLHPKAASAPPPDVEAEFPK